MDRGLLKNIKNVVPALSHLCSNVEGITLTELDDATLSKSIADLDLRVNFSRLLFLTCFIQIFYLSQCFAFVGGDILVFNFFFFVIADQDFGN